MPSRWGIIMILGWGITMLLPPLKWGINMILDTFFFTVPTKVTICSLAGIAHLDSFSA
jgi:hypothetical protein